MSLLHSLTILLLVIGLVCSAGCSELSGAGNRIPGESASGPTGRQTIAQPEDTARMIRMETDLYTTGDIVEFVITNEKSGDLSCRHDPPMFSVRYQKDTGQWVTRMGDENPPPGNTTTIGPGKSTEPYRFITTGWAPGRYRIVTDCDVSRDILIRAVPGTTPSGSSCPPGTNTSPFIRVAAVSDQRAGEPFAITGTTNLPAGEELRYSIFALLPLTGNVTSAKLVSSTTTVASGTCGVNTWSVNGIINVPGEYFIGISNSGNTISAVKRFTVLEKTAPAESVTLPERTGAPGIMTGCSPADPQLRHPVVMPG
ncbi:MULTISPECIES: hypothetical protein [unclassified Methanoregula]|uniref:hypothetical protein n=1 Tax=unclassified Methanoregula TaxID=2649730 RepID=UPI0009C44985|nr:MULTISPECIES: hypothetical protein [unclassified Methanoregula]OPX65207.1 MAG: hypothetical protein A4E33_00239 [Methanoregula sp. PtaB.Bin085]OPY32116.1 MAG: hypothetical protein A4E34_02489 [Methanoregula sp. PtaU1.Bin006]